jgi:hypothetical protein
MRKKIKCEEAVVKRTKTYFKAAQSEWDGSEFKYITYELSDQPGDPDARRLELYALKSAEYHKIAQAIETEVQEQMRYMPSYARGKFEKTMEQAAQKREIHRAMNNAGRTSLIDSLAASVTNCEGPVKDSNAFFLRRKKCGADVLGRILPQSVMQQRNHEARLLKKYGLIRTFPEMLADFKPIR